MNNPALRPASLREQFTRGLPRDKSDTLLLIGACALVMMPHAWHLPAWVTLAASALLLWRGWVTFRGNRMPSRWLLLPVVALLMTGVYFSYRTFLGREAGVCMLVLLLASLPCAHPPSANRAGAPRRCPGLRVTSDTPCACYETGPWSTSSPRTPRRSPTSPP